MLAKQILNPSLFQILIIMILVVVYGLSIILTLIGLIGAIKESFCLSCTYTVLCGVATLIMMAIALINPYGCVFFVIDLQITILWASFTQDLYTMRKARQQSRSYV